MTSRTSFAALGLERAHLTGTASALQRSAVAAVDGMTAAEIDAELVRVSELTQENAARHHHRGPRPVGEVAKAVIQDAEPKPEPEEACRRRGKPRGPYGRRRYPKRPTPDNGWIKVAALVIGDSDDEKHPVSTGAKVCLLLLIRLQGERHWLETSTAALAARLRCARRTVQGYLQELRKAGYIATDPQYQRVRRGDRWVTVGELRVIVRPLALPPPYRPDPVHRQVTLARRSTNQAVHRVLATCERLLGRALARVAGYPPSEVAREISRPPSPNIS